MSPQTQSQIILGVTIIIPANTGNPSKLCDLIPFLYEQ